MSMAIVMGVKVLMLRGDAPASRTSRKRKGIERESPESQAASLVYARAVLYWPQAAPGLHWAWNLRPRQYCRQMCQQLAVLQGENPER